MSNAVLQLSPGLSWPIIKSTQNSTTVKTAVSGREYRKANWSSPKYVYQFIWDVLRQGQVNGANYTEMAYLMGFINARQGSFDSFLYTDPDDSTVSLQQFGTGDGSSKVFQLVRTLGGYIEPVFDLNGSPNIFDNGSLLTNGVNYTINSYGVVTFVAAPAGGHALTWTGAFYWRCRFQLDNADFSKILTNIWELQQSPLSMITVKP
jgi:uncharacterized protein (TIGR02217 family)